MVLDRAQKFIGIVRRIDSKTGIYLCVKERKRSFMNKNQIETHWKLGSSFFDRVLENAIIFGVSGSENWENYVKFGDKTNG